MRFFHTTGDLRLLSWYQESPSIQRTDLFWRTRSIVSAKLSVHRIIQFKWLSRDEIEHANGLRVFISHGEKDHTVEYKLGVRSRDILKRYGYNVTFQSFEGGHNLPPKEILVQAIDWIEGRH